MQVLGTNKDKQDSLHYKCVCVNAREISQWAGLRENVQEVEVPYFFTGKTIVSCGFFPKANPLKQLHQDMKELKEQKDQGGMDNWRPWKMRGTTQRWQVSEGCFFKIPWVSSV